jgi:hypothetical protein
MENRRDSTHWRKTASSQFQEVQTFPEVEACPAFLAFLASQAFQGGQVGQVASSFGEDDLVDEGLRQNNPVAQEDLPEEQQKDLPPVVLLVEKKGSPGENRTGQEFQKGLIDSLLHS